MTVETDPILVIDLSLPWADCYRCGKATPHKWGLPVDESGAIVPTWYESWWGGVPACKGCYELHQQWSEELFRPFDAPLC